MYHTCVGCTLVLFGVRLSFLVCACVCLMYAGCTVVLLLVCMRVLLLVCMGVVDTGPVRVFLCVHCVFLCVHCVFVQGVRAGYAFVHVVCAGAGACMCIGAGACMCIGAVLRYLIVYACKAGRA